LLATYRRSFIYRAPGTPETPRAADGGGRGGDLPSDSIKSPIDLPITELSDTLVIGRAYRCAYVLRVPGMTIYDMSSRVMADGCRCYEPSYNEQVIMDFEIF